MTDKALSPLRRRLIEDMAIGRLGPKTEHEYIRHVRRFADFAGRSANKPAAEDVRRYQLWLASIGATVPTVNAGASALRFFFGFTLKRRDLADAVVLVREPRRLLVVLSPEEVGRLFISTRNIKHRAAPEPNLCHRPAVIGGHIAEAHGIDSERMVIRVEQGKSLPPRRRGATRIAT